MKQIRYLLEACLLAALIGICRLLPAKTASNAIGRLARFIGPRLAATRKARRNLERALPHLNEHDKTRILEEMWENLGRVIAEYPHLETLVNYHTELVRAEIQTDAMASGKGAIFIGAHLGNWEINGPASFLGNHIKLALAYRAPNNPWVDAMLQRCRSLNGTLETYPKSRAGGRSMMETIKNGGCLGLLIDQKYREGLEVPFFGMPAMTNPFFVQLAQKYDVPVIPVRCERLDGAQFRLTVYEPVQTKNRTAEDIIAEVHDLLESWIKERPGQWLWLHRRWKDD